MAPAATGRTICPLDPLVCVLYVCGWVGEQGGFLFLLVCVRVCVCVHACVRARVWVSVWCVGGF